MRRYRRDRPRLSEKLRRSTEQRWTDDPDWTTRVVDRGVITAGRTTITTTTTTATNTEATTTERGRRRRVGVTLDRAGKRRESSAFGSLGPKHRHADSDASILSCLGRI
jgi:hypothetical protein